MQQKSYNSIDIAKLFMAICVVAIHTNPLYSCENQIVVAIYTTIISCAVPFFFICTGFLLGKRAIDSSDNGYSVVKKSAIKMLKLYLIWSVIYLPPAIVDYAHSGNSIAHILISYIKGLVINGEHYNSWILWYILSSFYALVFVGFLIKRKLSIEKISLLGGGMLCVYFALNAIYDNASTLPQQLLSVKKLLDLTIGIGRPLQGFFYIPFGMLLAKRKSANPISYCLSFILGFLLTLQPNESLARIALAITAISLFCIVNSIDLPDSKIYYYMRKSSTAIYFVHLYAWMLVYMVLYGKKTYGFTAFALTTAISILVSIIWIAINNMLKSNKSKKEIPAS